MAVSHHFNKLLKRVNISVHYHEANVHPLLKDALEWPAWGRRPTRREHCSVQMG
jgi:hypothetical protein